MIFTWNPRTNKVFVPEKSVTIPNVTSYGKAKELVLSDGFVPENWKYIVKSKTGKPHNFASKDDALRFAEQKSTKRIICTVYENGVAIAAFVNKKQLQEWTTVFVNEDKPVYEIDRPSKKEFYNDPFNKNGDWFYKETIEKANDKVRFREIRIHYNMMATGYLVTRFVTKSVTFHKDGSVYCFDKNKIVHKPASEIWLSNNKSVLEILREELAILRPELKTLLRVVEGDNIAGVFSRPTAYFSFDTYHRKAQWKKRNLYYGYFPKEIVDEAKRMRVPVTKSLRKLYNANLCNMNVVHFLKSIGFKDPNSYNKLTGVGVRFSMSNPNRLSDFYKRFIELRGENAVAKMLSDTDFNLINDVARTYHLVDKEIADLIMKESRNIEEIHVAFNSSVREDTCLIDEKISYTKAEKERYNYTCKDGVRFELADSSKELAIIGYRMGICVGGYADFALRKITTIVKMINNNNYVGCIEVRNNAVVQIKAKFNNPLEAKYKDDVDEWLAHCNVECGCHDYSIIGKPWTCNTNFAFINPGAFERRDDNRTLRIEKYDHVSRKHNNDWFNSSQVETYMILERIHRENEYPF